MEKVYRAKRHLQRRSQIITSRHFGWGLVCIIVLVVIGAMWVQLQSVTNQNASLRKQLSALQEPISTCQVSGSWRQNQTKSLSLSINGAARSYLVHIPQSFRPDKYYPLVMFYVGRGATASGGEIAYGLDALPAVVVYPVPTVGQQDMTAWEGAPYSSGADDIALTSSILSQVESDLCIDRTRVYAMGISNGGGFVSLLSCRLPGKFAAYAAVAGAMYPPESTCKPPIPTPLISIHGDRDATVPYDGSLTRHLPPIESWVAQRATDNGCMSPTTTYPAANVILTSWNSCQDGTKVQNVRIEGGGHAWGAVPNDMIWQFLNQFSL